MNNTETINKFSNLETAAFCDQMVLILKSGVSSLEGITVMLEDSESAAEKEILQIILNELESYGSFHEALRKTNAFPEYLLNMTQIGEESGRLDEVMGELALHYEREDAIRRSIRSTVTYPLIMTGMLVVVVIVLLTKVLPIFDQVFRQLGTELAGVSKALVGIGKAISTYSIVFIAILAIIAICIILAFRTEKGRVIARKFGYRFRTVRSIVDGTSACRFAGGMALALSSGLTPDRSMELAASLVSDEHFNEKLTKCRELMDQGTELSAALQEVGIFSGVYSRIASIGNKTGSMEQSMSKIAKLYQDEIDNRLNNLLAVVEPSMVIILSIVVGVILLSVMLPLVGIMAGI